MRMRGKCIRLQTKSRLDSLGRGGKGFLFTKLMK